MRKNSARFQKEIDRLLSNYLRDVSLSDLKPLSARTYGTQAENFVRWIKGGFRPGSRRQNSAKQTL